MSASDSEDEGKCIAWHKQIDKTGCHTAVAHCSDDNRRSVGLETRVVHVAIVGGVKTGVLSDLINPGTKTGGCCSLFAEYEARHILTLFCLSTSIEKHEGF